MNRRTNHKNSSEMSRIRQQIAHLKRQTSAIPIVRPASGDPPPVTNNGRWVERKVYLVNPGSDLTLGEISTALQSSNGVGARGDFYIVRIACWGSPGGTISTNIAYANLLTTGRSAGGTDQAFVSDTGTNSRLPGFRVDIPRSVALLQNFDTAATTAVLNAATDLKTVHVSVVQLI